MYLSLFSERRNCSELPCYAYILHFRLILINKPLFSRNIKVQKHIVHAVIYDESDGELLTQVRFYWSMVRISKRCQYICSIHEVDGKPEFRVSVQEENCKESVFKSESAQGAWHQVLDVIMKLRIAADSIKVFPKFITGEDLFGLTEPAIVKVLAIGH